MSLMVSGAGRRWLTLGLGLGLGFLYAPILLVMLFSFNASSSTTLWSGFSLRWYRDLAGNDAVLQAAGLSLLIATLSACGATLLGTLVAAALARGERFPGRTLLFGMATAPLVVPEVILAVALLLLFVGAESLIGWPQGRGILTITLAHISYTAAFVTLVVLQVFLLITLPGLAPAMAAGWLLGFSVSLDDVVITQFTSGPGSTTLPLLIFSLVRRGVKPDINAIATLFVLGAVLVTVLLAVLQRWRRGRSLP
jgi:putrescine transport system permease protein